MAETIEHFEEDLTCPIYVEVFRESVLLPCQHSFCRGCPKTYAAESDVHEEKNGIAIVLEPKVISCPVCRSSVDLGVKGVAGLPVQLNLASSVEKHRGQGKMGDEIPKCSMCEDEEKQTALKVCVTCSIFYCEDCVRLHPMRGPLKEHNLIMGEEYLSRKNVKETTGNNDDIIDTADLCVEHGLEILLFCGPCQRPLCKGCFAGHRGHPMEDIQAKYHENIKLLEEKTKVLKQQKYEVVEMLTELAEFKADVEEKESLHILEIEKAYNEVIEAADEWRKDKLQIIGNKHEEWRLSCLSSTKDLQLKMSEIENLLKSSNELLSGRWKSYLKDLKSIKRIYEMPSTTRGDLRRHRQLISEWRADMDCDEVIPRRLFIKETKISDSSQEWANGQIESGAALVSVKQEGSGKFNGALTNWRFQTGYHYWELDLSFNVRMTQGEQRLVYSAGVVRDGSDFGRRVGGGKFTWGVAVAYYSGSQYEIFCVHDTQVVSVPLPVYPDTAGERGTVKQGFFLDCDDRTPTILDVTHSRVLHTFNNVNVDEPLTPAVSVHDYNWVNVSVRLIPGHLSSLFRVLPDAF